MMELRTSLILLMLGMCLVETLSKQLPFGARLGVKRVRTKAKTTAAPFLIDWSNSGDWVRRERQSLFGGYIPPPESEESNLPEPFDPPQVDPSQDPIPDFSITDNPDPTTPPIPDVPVIDPEVPGVIINPIIPTTTFNIDDIPFTPVINPPTNFVNVDDIPFTPPIINNPITEDSPNLCTIITETVYDQIEEKTCTVVNTNSCKVTNDCYKTVENQCKDVATTEVQEVCQDNFINVCEDVLGNFTRNICEFVNETKCDPEYETQYKDECTYETVYEEVCSTGYLIYYEEKCKAFLGKNKCKKTPKYPTKQCRKVPRIEGKCKKVPVLRPNNCREVERVLCREEPYQTTIRSCVVTNSPICSQQPIETVRNVCDSIEREICTVLPVEANDTEACQDVPENICETKLVPFTRIIEREDCNNDVTDLVTQYSNLDYSSERYKTTFL